jgi:predicted MFS family arabinose efflux permease
MSLLARYREVLGTGGAGPALLFSVIGRLSLGMTGLAILLLVRASTGSYAAAGAVSAAYAIAFAVGSPGRARSADRQGPVRVLLRCGLTHPVALLALAVLAEQSAPVVLLALIAIGAGLTAPPLGAVMRALWGQLVQGPALATAYSLESVAVELCFVVGPGLTALAVAVSGPAAAMATSGAMTLIGGVGLARSRAVRAVRPHPDAAHSLAGPLTSRAVLSLLLTVVWIGAGFGAVEIAMPAFAEAHGSRPAAAGVLLAIWAAGSMAGGLLYGGLAPSRPPAQQLPWLVTALAVGGSLPLLAQGRGTMAVALFAYGFTIAPFFSCNSWLLGAAAPAGTTTEAFAWNSSMIFGGAAIGTALAGALAEHSGPTAALAVTSVAGLLTVVTSLAGRRLVPVSAR